MRSDNGVFISGTGSYLPPHIQTNEELCANIDDVTPEWIIEKTGIKRRYVAQPGETASGYSIEAAKKALEMANIAAEELDAVIVCTFSGDYIYPPVSAKIAWELGAKKAQIFDVQANCSGFVTGLTVGADRLLVDPFVKNVLVIGVELHTRFIDKSDVNTAIYFSDGAGAAVLSQCEDPGFGFQASDFHTDASTYEAVRFRGGGSSYPFENREFDPKIDFMEMNGLATWKQAVTHLPRVVKGVCKKVDLNPADVDMFLFHQANYNLIEYVVKKMKQDMSKTYTNVREIGNTGAASIAIVLDEANRAGKLNAGDIVLFAGVGAGFNFGASIFKWGSHV